MSSVLTAKGTSLPLLDLKGKPYLQVPWRIVWLREDHPDWVFDVTFPVLDDKKVMAKATILDEKGAIRATAHKVEHFAHFADAVEKAETGAIGRALGMLGYGTQFAIDLEEDRLADAPLESVKPKTTAAFNNQNIPVSNKNAVPLQEPNKPLNHAPTKSGGLSEAQIKRFYALLKKANWTDDDAKRCLKMHFGVEKSSDLSRDQYDLFCDYLQKNKTLEQVMSSPTILNN